MPAPHGLFQTLSGKEGTVRITSLGAVVGIMQSWKLMRRGDGGPNEGLYDLHAVFSYSNPALLNHEQYAKDRTIVVKLGRREYTIERAREEAKFAVEGRQLIVEEVRLSG